MSNFLLQTEEEFLAGLTQDLQDDPLDRDDDDDDDESDDESDDGEEAGDQEREKSQNVEKRSPNFPLTIKSRADIGSMVNALQQEGKIKTNNIFMTTRL